MVLQDKKVHVDKCPFCNKEFVSLYENQLESNLAYHKMACKKNPQNSSRCGKFQEEPSYSKN